MKSDKHRLTSGARLNTRQFYLISGAGKDRDNTGTNTQARRSLGRIDRAGETRPGIGTNFEVSEKGTPTDTVECRDERANTPRECTQVFETTRKASPLFRNTCAPIISPRQSMSETNTSPPLPGLLPGN